MKSIISVLLLLVSLNATSQIKIGQSTDEVLYFLEHISKSKDWEIEKTYYNGEVQQIIVHQYNQLFYDLNKRTDAIDYYFLEDGKYMSKETQLMEVSIEYLQQQFDKLYSSSKIGDYYFTDDYFHYQILTLENGTATITYAKTDVDLFPKPMKDEILKRRNTYNKEIENKTLVLDSIRTMFVNVDDYVDGYTQKIYHSLEKGASQSISIEEMIGRTNIKGSYKVRLYANRGRKFATVRIEKISDSDYFPSTLQNNLRLKLPVIAKTYNGRDYELNREANFILNYDLIVGELILKNRGAKTKFPSNITLTQSQKESILNELLPMKKGTYKLYYQFGTINDTDATELRFLRLK